MEIDCPPGKLANQIPVMTGLSPPCPNTRIPQHRWKALRPIQIAAQQKRSTIEHEFHLAPQT
jgi:hypothetical protein